MNNSFKKRIDELGRIVIPKEIRNTFKMKNFDEVELFIEGNSIVMKKILGLQKYTNKFKNLFDFLDKVKTYDLIIIEDNKILISSNSNFVEADLIQVDLNKDKFIQGNIELIKNKKYNGCVFIEPLIIESNLLGHLIILSENTLEREDIKHIKQLILDLID